jgi:hypothetical protein
MSDDPRHRLRRRRLIQVERLESRALLSLGKVEELDLVISQPQAANQQEGAFTVTLTVMKPRDWDAGLPAAAADQPVTVDLMASLQSPPAYGVPEATPPASPVFAPVSESVTFPAGVSTQTVTVPITSSAATPGMAEIWLTTTAFTSSYFTVTQAEPVCAALYSSPAAVPPSITGVHLVTQGKGHVLTDLNGQPLANWRLPIGFHPLILTTPMAVGPLKSTVQTGWGM